MVDPNEITNYKRNDEQLLEFWLFCIFVRGKNADVQAKKLGEFLTYLGGIDTVLHHDPKRIDETLRLVGAGQYNTMVPAILQTLKRIKADPEFLRKATVADLEKIKGVGPKTARFFILHTRPKARVAVLDTHILNYMGEHLNQDIPRTTPGNSAKYAALEEAFLLQADFERVDPAAFDLAIWRASRESNPMDWRRYLE